jgi:WD40 repeat protein
LNTGRFGSSATLLPNGRVLITGGQDASGGESASAELFDAATGTFSQTGPMIYPHISPAAVLLGDGRVLVTGGPLGTVLKRDRSAELFDAATGKFSLTGSMKVARSGQGTALLADGRVLFAGGATTLLAKSGGYYVPGADIVLASAELYDPVTGQFKTTGSMSTAREDSTATLLPDGRVLIAGGSVQASSDGWKPTASAELYSPTTGKFSPTGEMATARVGHTATLLPDGRVLIAGGYGSSGNVLASAELYDPKTGTFSPTGSMATVRGDHTATLLPDGRVLIAGGADAPDDGLAANILASAELYDPKTGTFSPAGSMATARQLQTATLLLDGRVLIAGGADGSTHGPGMVTALALPSAELYQP